MNNDTITKTCRGKCGLVKTLSEFYVHLGYKDGHYSKCKECIKAEQRNRRAPKKQKPGHLSEGEVISLLKAMGVYAAPGKCSEFNYVDVVAWGCVRIEVKTSTRKTDGTYTFAFTPKQRKNGVRGDLIMLVCKDGDSTTHHLFPSNHSCFYMNGRLKGGVMFDPVQTRRKSGHGARITAALMKQHQDAWGLIEIYRKNHFAIVSGEQLTPTFMMRQLNLF